MRCFFTRVRLRSPPDRPAFSEPARSIFRGRNDVKAAILKRDVFDGVDCRRIHTGGFPSGVKILFITAMQPAMNFRRLISKDRPRRFCARPPVRHTLALLLRVCQSRAAIALSHNRPPIGSLGVYLCKIAYHNLHCRALTFDRRCP